MKIKLLADPDRQVWNLKFIFRIGMSPFILANHRPLVFGADKITLNTNPDRQVCIWYLKLVWANLLKANCWPLVFGSQKSSRKLCTDPGSHIWIQNIYFKVGMSQLFSNKPQTVSLRKPIKWSYVQTQTGESGSEILLIYLRLVWVNLFDGNPRLLVFGSQWK